MNILHKPIEDLATGNGKFVRALTILFIAVTIAGIYFHTQPDFYTWSSIFIFIQSLIYFAIIIFQRGKYVIYRNKTVKLDEREMAVRRRIYEKAYSINLGILLLFLVLSSSQLQAAARQIISSPINNISSVFVSLLWLLLAIPPILAAWDKES